MAVVSNAGQPATHEQLANIPQVVSSYYTSEVKGRVSFGTSGHRGSSLKGSFTEKHIAAIVQAICDLREEFGASGPLFLGMDTHALSWAAHETALSVLAGNKVKAYVATEPEFTPTPVVSRSIIRYNEGRDQALADGIVITPSHNPPEDGGIKYNSTHGGPAGEEMTRSIAARANYYLEVDKNAIRRQGPEKGRKYILPYDYAGEYIRELDQIIDFEVIRRAGLKLGADALGGAGYAYWKRIAETYGLDITPMHDYYDPTFSFMCIDHDGRIRMDCSSPYAMAGLVALKDSFDLGVANDPDFDRHGIVCPGSGLMNPNHYLAVAVQYLFTTRKAWSSQVGVGNTMVSSMMIDRVANGLNRKLLEVPVGFKWFVPGLSEGTIGFGGEESAGASFLTREGKTWTTDKDGIVLALLAAEMTARTGKTPAQLYQELEATYGRAYYARQDSPATLTQKVQVAALQEVPFRDLAGDPIVCVQTRAPGNQAAFGGVKICAANSWAAVRPSGTEDICKVYAESLVSADHLQQVLRQAAGLLGL